MPDKEPHDRHPGPVRISDVAERAGVSTATVSRTLTAPDRVSPDTRARVLAAVAETGYAPNIAGRNLRAALTRIVLLVIPSLITPFFSELVRGIDLALAERGYSLLVGSLHDRPVQEPRLVSLVAARGVDGLILLSGRMIGIPPRRVDQMGIPVVAVGVPPLVSDPPASVPTLLVDDRDGGAQVARHFLALGHRRFGYVAGPLGGHNEVERWAGFMGTLAEAGVAEAGVTRYPGNFSAAAGAAAAGAYLASRTRPTAIFAISDMMAIGFLHRLASDGVVAPRDVSVAGFDGIEFADHSAPALTTVRQPREEMGRAAAELLIRLITEGRPATPPRLTLPVTLRIADSTGPVPGGG